jgi:hypothetical protein
LLCSRVHLTTTTRTRAARLRDLQRAALVLVVVVEDELDCRAKESRAEQSRAEQGRAEQRRAAPVITAEASKINS